MVAGRSKLKIYPSTDRQRGFTLVEILIAIFIFAIVISSVYGSYRATFHIVHVSEHQIEIANSARVVMERFAEDLGSIVTGPGELFNGERHDFSGARGDSLSFISLAHLVLRKTDVLAGPALIEYQVESGEESGLLDLYRLDGIVLPGVELGEKDLKKYLICRGLQEFRITYLDSDGNESENWQVDEVTSGNGGTTLKGALIPSLVSVELKFAGSQDSDSSTVFKTVVALPQMWSTQK